MAKKWYKGIWEQPKLNVVITEEFYGKRETKSFYDPQDLTDGYEVRGMGLAHGDKVDLQRDPY